MRLWLFALVLSACNGKTLAPDTDGLDTGDVDTSDVDTSDPDTDTEPAPLTDVTRMQPVAGGTALVSSETYDLTVTVGTPVHSTQITSENYRLTVGVVAPSGQ
jgi:hypothetical protein